MAELRSWRVLALERHFKFTQSQGSVTSFHDIHSHRIRFQAYSGRSTFLERARK